MTIVLRADHRGFLCHCFCTHRFSRRAHGGDADDDDEGDADHGVSDSDNDGLRLANGVRDAADGIWWPHM